MGLIKCWDCNADISTRAISCPRCGSPNGKRSSDLNSGGGGDDGSMDGCAFYFASIMSVILFIVLPLIVIAIIAFVIFFAISKDFPVAELSSTINA